MPRPSPASQHPTPGSSWPARHVCVVAAAALLCVIAAPAAWPDSAAPSPSSSAKPPAGLYGAADPTYDGVWRQSTALLALAAAKAAPPARAVSWLTGQQCPDGGFGAFRADPATACKAKSEDSNSTALAVQALARIGGHGTAVDSAVNWLKAAQNKDGGWGYQPGDPSDTDSTAVVAGALTAAGTDPSRVTKDGTSPLDALLSWQLGCDAKAGQRGAFAYQPDAKSGKLAANDKATTDGVIGVHGSGYLVVAPGTDRSPKPLDCSTGKPGKAVGVADAAQAGSAYLVAALSAGGQHLSTTQPGSDKKSPDYGTTADAVIALASDGNRSAARKPYDWLAGNGGAWAKGDPAALGSLILASTAVGADPHDFGGVDLVTWLSDTGPASATPASLSPSARQKDHGSGGGHGAWWIAGIGVLAVLGIGWAVGVRRRKQS